MVSSSTQVKAWFGIWTSSEGTGPSETTWDGQIAAIGNLSGRPADRTLRCEGREVTPGLVDSHIHLDKALLSDRTPSVEGTLQGAIRITGEAKRQFTVDDIRTRARAVLDMAVRRGTTAMRSHVEVDPIVQLRGVEALLSLKAEYCSSAGPPALRLRSGGRVPDVRDGATAAKRTAAERT